MTDATGTLFRRLLSGDYHALGSLYELHSPRILRYLEAVLGSRHCAEDALQNTSCLVIRHMTSLKVPEKFPIWLRRIAHREALKVLRESPVDDNRDNRGQPGRDHEPDPSALFARQEDVASIRSALEELPAAHREVLWLFVVDGLSHTEIAKIAEIPIGTSRSRLHNALRKLRTMLDAPEGRS